jgi:small-conductance mechanosensitive channel
MQPSRNGPRIAVVLLWGLAIAPGIQGVARAQRDERATVRVDGRAVFRVGSQSGETADARRRRIEQRIGRLLEQPDASSSITVERLPRDSEHRQIVASGVPITTVAPEDAEDNFTSVQNLAELWSETLETALERAQARRRSAGGRFTSEVRGAIESAFGRMFDSAIRLIPRALAALLVLFVFWLLASLTRRAMRSIVRRFVKDLTVENLIVQVAFYTVWVIGILLAADALGFDPDTVITGLGLSGLILGFALKDILSNFVSGILILTLRSFRLGDQIVVGDTEGNVERIELRATQIRTYDGRAVIVPNGELLTSRIVNNTAAPVRRGSVEIGLSYKTELHRARDAVLAAMQAVSGVLPEPEPSVRIRKLAADAIVMEGRFWTDSRRSDFLATQSAVAEGIIERFQLDGLPLPDPAERLLAPSQLIEWRAIVGASNDRIPR